MYEQGQEIEARGRLPVASLRAGRWGQQEVRGMYIVDVRDTFLALSEPVMSDFR